MAHLGLEEGSLVAVAVGCWGRDKVVGVGRKEAAAEDRDRSHDCLEGLVNHYRQISIGTGMR